MKRSLVAIGLMLCAHLALGQHPNDARGFEAGKVYNFNDVDTVNSFNGNLMVHLPIGPVYTVNGALSYRLGLSYNSHCWRFDATTDESGDVIKAFPIGSFNAGLGWTLSLGRLFEGGDPETRTAVAWTYQSSDGADHSFYETLHNAGEVIVPDTFYTRDGSYMRLSKAGQIRVVELGDGTKNEFTRMTRTTGDWPTSTSGTNWLLTGISDQFGNRVTISYSTVAPYAEIWTIADGARTTSVYFYPSPTPSHSQSPSPSDVVLDHIDTQMVNGSLATYTFARDTLDVPLPLSDTTNRGTTLTVTVLTSVTPPTGNPYRMTLNGHPAYDTTSTTTSGRGPTPGVLTRLVLPTLGSIGWTHDRLQFTPGSQDRQRSPAIEFPTGVVARKTYDASGQLLGTWTYGRQFSRVPIPCNPTPFCLDGNGQPLPECPSGRSRQLTTWVTEPSIAGEDTRTTINYFSNYEYISTNPNGDTCDTAPEGWKHSEHGLPFTRYEARDGRFLSSEVRTGNIFSGDPWPDGRGMIPPPSPTGGKRVRATYVTYQLDNVPYVDEAPFDYNAIPNSTATYFYDDTSNCGTGTEPCYFTIVNNLGFDIYGHFRQTSTDGDLPGTGNFRTTFTNYNAAPTASSSWLLNTSTERCTADESSRRTAPLTSCNDVPGALITKTQYDAFGVLTARRTLLNSGGALAPSDLLATFEHDGHGSLTSEQFYGGDTQALGISASAPFATVDNATPPATISAKYAITHALTYTSNALTRDTATYANGVTASDLKYDQSTGLVTDTLDIAGLTTHYIYDLLGRVKNVQPPGVAETTYTYSDASIAGSAFTPAKVVADSSSSGLGSVRKEYQYDPFGRLWRQKSLLDDGVSYSIVQNDFDALGRKSAVSMPEKLVGSESSFVPAHTTKYRLYDAFDRAATVEAPDGYTTNFVFTGIRSIQRTVKVATSSTGCTPADGTGCTDAITEEIHDATGRLVQVSEHSGDTSLSKPNGDLVTTTYKYDSGNHLTEVRTLSQVRTFTYDNRGFLQSEQHPEIGATGGGVIQYVYDPTSTEKIGYDARGHAHGKLTGPVNGFLDLRYVYDSSERLTAVTDFGDSLRKLKDYSYWTANDAANPPNLGQGKLHQAVRHNHPAGFPGEVTVAETYTYATPSQSGRISKRETLVESVDGSGSRTTLQSLTQSSTYDQLGSIARIDYPACVVACTGSPSTTGPAYTRANGFLTGVTGYASPITYNPDGSIFEVTHDATYGVKDTYKSDSSAMGRPGVISFAGACTVSAAVSGDTTITSGQLATISAVLSGGAHPPSTAAPWTITWFDGANSVSENSTQSLWTRNVYPTVTTHYTITSVTDGSCFGSSSGTATVTVQSCNASAAVTGDANITQGQTTTITATLTGANPPSGAAPWSITWSDGVTENGVNHSPWTRSVRPLGSTNYTVTSFTAGAGCSGAGTGLASVTVAPLPAPATMSATSVTDPNTNTTLTVSVQWSVVQFADWYQVERATRLSLNDWQPISGHVTSPWPNTFGTTADPVAYLYRVRAGVTSGGVDVTSTPSPIDYATVATTLFTDERLAAGVTRIKGIHIGELRHAIDAVRIAAGLSPVFSYGQATGPVTASDNTTARQRLDEARFSLFGAGHNWPYTGETPARNGKIWAYQLQQIRDGVR
jgi:hypothetical protein